MTRIGDSDRVTVGSTTQTEASVFVSPSLDSPLTLASAMVARRGPRATSTHGTGAVAVTDRAQQSAAADIAAAFAGNPESFLARIALEMRRTRSAIQETGILAETSAADTAEKAREAAQAAATKAAEKATGFLGLGKTFNLVAKIASAVVAVASTVVTCGAAAPVAAGLLLMTFGGDLAKFAVKNGLCPESMKAELTTALKLTGAVLITAASFGAGVAAIGSVVLEATSADIVDAAADAFDMSAEARSALTITLSVAASVLATVAGGAASAGSSIGNGAVRTALVAVRDGGHAVAAGAQLESAATDVGAALANHDAAHSRADAQEASTNRDGAYERADDHVEGLKSALKAYGRAMKMARQAQEARGQALRAATQHRA